MIEISYTVLEAALDPAELEAAIPTILDQTQIEEGSISSYEIVEVESAAEGDAVATAFTFSSDELGDGQGNLILRQVGQTPYQLLSITLADSAFAEEVWQTVVDSFAATPAEPAATPQSEPTSTPEPSATPTSEPTSTRKPTTAPTSEPTPTPEPTAMPEEEKKLEVFTYEHPSGRFSVDIPKGVEYDEDEDRVTYGDVTSFLIEVSFMALETALGPAELEAAIPAILDQSLIEEGPVSSYEIVKVESMEGGAFATAFTFTSAELGYGEGKQILRQLGQTLYEMISITLGDDAYVNEVWQTAVDSFTPTPAGSAAPADTPVPPTAAVTPKPQPTATPKPPAPPPAPASKGCYMFQDFLGVDLTVTFTAQDWDWSDSFSIPANGEKEYCLDPGRYTYTVDAPPPWSDINGELVVQAGDRYLWPIEGQH